MTAPNFRTIDFDAHWGDYTYKLHDIHIERKDSSENWYITVIAPSGAYAYDGWWTGSRGKSRREAVLEALRGACLFTNASGDQVKP